MRTTLHAASEGVSWEAHTDGGHLSSGEGSVHEECAPCIHALLPVDEGRGDHLRDVVSNFSRALSDGPEEPPLGVVVGRELGERHVLGGELVDHRLVVAGALLSLWSHTCLEVDLRLAVLQLFTLVQLTRFLLEVLLHHVEVVLVVLLDDSGVADNEDTELVERLGDLLALNEVLLGVFFEEGFYVDDGYVSNRVHLVVQNIFNI